MFNALLVIKIVFGYKFRKTLGNRNQIFFNKTLTPN